MSQDQRGPQASSSTQTLQPNREQAPEPAAAVGVLKLRGAPSRRRVMWEQGTIDNEGMGKKKSKSQ